jgi:hypothetical protein
MSYRTMGLIFILLGALVSVVSLTADPLGLGAAPTIVGWKQLTGSNFGIFIAIFGLWLSQAKSKNGKDGSK